MVSLSASQPVRLETVESIPAWLGLSTWQYDSFFDPIPNSAGTDLTSELEQLVEDARLDQHEFFAMARRSKNALTLWVSQELVMTNTFSQLVLAAAAQIRNVHARAVLAEIAYGEHGRSRQGIAKRAHPWLLERMRASIDLSRSEVQPRQPTIDFIARLASRIDDPLQAIAFIGIGNERLIGPEYAAIRTCFQSQYPDADFEPFLKANIDEDITHARLCYELAALLISSQKDREQFLDASAASIQSRIEYFDDLAALAS